MTQNPFVAAHGTSANGQERPEKRIPLRIHTLLCDPDVARANEVYSCLGRSFTVTTCDAMEHVAQCCRDRLPSAVLLAFPKPNADEVLQFLQEFGGHVITVLYGPARDLHLKTRCALAIAGVKKILDSTNPTFLVALRQYLTEAIPYAQQVAADQHDLIQRFERCGLIGRSPQLIQVFRQAIRVSNASDSPLLILGETGTGKQLLAEAIHALDPKRKRHDVLTINCSAINESLAESEFFGHSRGSFTNAGKDRLGWMRAADGGTVVLDEVGELDPRLQPKLLRVIENKRVLPIGTDAEQEVDVRIIAATNQPLAEKVREGTFRKDLFHRLSVTQIHIPPLHERREDIEPQARYFLRRLQPEKQRVTDIHPHVLELLQFLPWEGNSRELDNLIRDALITKEYGDSIELQDLPHRVLQIGSSGMPK